MEFVELTEKEFQKFADKHEQESFFQTVELANLRRIYGSNIHYLGVKENKKIIAGAMFSETKTMFGKSTFYAPRGYLMDYHNVELLKFFTFNLKKYFKNRNGMMIKIDPNVIYRVRTGDGDIIPDGYNDMEVIPNLKRLGYKHFGFTKDNKFTQCRWNFLVDLSIPYDELKKKFSKNTRKNIDATYKRGVRIRVAKEEDLESMVHILEDTAIRRNFRYRNLKYFQNMYHSMKDKMVIYMAYLDPDIYLESSINMLNEEKSHYKEIISKMERDMVGSKLINQKETSLKLIDKYKNEVELAKKFKEDYPNGLDIGTLISMKSGKEYLTLYSGILSEYKKFTPKYAMYNEHILDAYKFGIPYVDFYGIPGTFDPKDPEYGVYEFKRGFNGNVIELIGEFTYPLSFTYYIYMFFRRGKILYRKLFKK